MPKSSAGRKIGRPWRISSGPPPTASGTSRHSGRNTSRTVSVSAVTASTAIRWACVPRAASTAPPGGIGVPPRLFSETKPTRSAFGVADGKGESTASNTPLPVGVVGP